MIALRFLLIVASTATLVSCSFVELESRRLDDALSKLEEAFPTAMKSIFWSNKVQAEYLMKTGREQEGKELLNAAQIASFIESVKYAIRKKSLTVVKQAIEQRFVEDGIVLLDKKSQINLRPAMLTILVSRVILRGYADSDRFSASYWGWLHKLIERYIAVYPTNNDFKILAVNAYQQMLQLTIDSQKARRAYEFSLRSSLAEMQIDELQTNHIVASLDQMIEEMLECKSCARVQPELARFNTRPMFDGEAGIKQAVAENVDPKVVNAFVELEGVFYVSPEEQASVSKSDIESLMQKLIDGL